ncbi:hypothetical protein, partial [Streptomyces sp. rh195]|uniref:hypothetical protein n=1 Tax=Streptomyces sp. rh195 TaxID=2034271 RepID=UPI00117C2B0F
MRHSDHSSSAESSEISAPTSSDRFETPSGSSGGGGVYPYRQTPGSCGGRGVRSQASTGAPGTGCPAGEPDPGRVGRCSTAVSYTHL